MTLQLFLLSLVFLSSTSARTAKATSSHNVTKQQDEGGWLPDDPSPNPRPEPYIPPEPEDTVTTPERGDVWEHGRSGYAVEWTDLEGHLVKVFLYKDGSRVAELSGWTDDEGYYSLEEDVLPSFGSGTGYQVMVEDNLGNRVWSAIFDVLAHVRVSEPGYRTEWATGQSDVRIEWQGAPGSTAKLELLHNDDLVADITEGWITNRGSYDLPYPIAEDWGSGEGYQVRVTDNIGNSATSPEFPIHGILVTQPNAETVWSDTNPTLDIAWEGGARVVRLALYQGETKIRDVSEWMDNAGSYRIENLAEFDLESSGNYRITIEDDQGNVGWSKNILISYTRGTIRGALERGGVTFPIVGHLAAGRTRYYSVDIEAGVYDLDFTSDDPIRIDFLSGQRRVATASNRETEFRANSSIDMIRLTNMDESLSNSTGYSIDIRERNVYFLPEHQITDAGLLGSFLGIGGLGIRYTFAQQHFSIGAEIASRSIYLSTDEPEYGPLNFPKFNTKIGILGLVLLSSAKYRLEAGPCIMSASYSDANDSEYNDLPEVQALREDIEGTNYGIFAQYILYRGSGDIRAGMNFSVSYFPSVSKVLVMNTLVTLGFSLLFGHSAYR